MSNKTQLQTNNTKLNSLIETLRGKAAGGSGGSVETANVTISVNKWDPWSYVNITATEVRDGETFSYAGPVMQGETLELSVVKNSVIITRAFGTNKEAYSTNGDVFYEGEIIDIDEEITFWLVCFYITGDTELEFI